MRANLAQNLSLHLPVDTAESIAETLGGHCTGDGYLTHCPAPNHGRGHGDRHPSLSVANSANGGVIVNCHAGCHWSDVRDELVRRKLLGPV